MRAPASDVATIRAFNRFYTLKIGVLREGLVDSEFSLTEVRVLYELAHRHGITASGLAGELELDAGYLSRILKRFESRGYLVRRTGETDARQRTLALTRRGGRAFATLDQRSSKAMARLVQPLSTTRRQSLVDAMATIETTLDSETTARAPVSLRRHRPGDMGWVVQRHGELYAHEYGWNEDFEALVAQIAAEFIQNLDPARERCWIVERNGRRIGSVFVVRKTAKVAKLRLLLVEPDARGIGLGRRLVDECIRFARRVGYRKLVLWTQSNLDAAHHVYAAAGFKLTDTQRHRSFGHDLVAETWELAL
jgi:DNA-binding MarR family transcriptional regulator/N-acetylglutamate synthase-like GNAT family acetyltransferase